MILSTLRDNREYTKEEAKLLDLCLMLHAEHGGGNNSTFTCRCVTSTGTDAYAAYASAISALKGPRHGGANIKVMEMLNCIENGVKNWENEGEVADFLTKILNKEENDHSGLIYGMGHAVYTLSDPRAVQLKKSALKLAKGTEVEAEFRLLDTIERLTPQLFAKNNQSTQNHRITIPYFRTWSTCMSHSQAPLCYCTPRTVTIRAEGTLGSLRYAFGGDHPSQTTHQTVSPSQG